MYLGVDVGGTKTLLAVFTKDGTLKQTVKFKTPQVYGQFLDALLENMRTLEVSNFTGVAVAVPGTVNREDGIGLSFGNLPWKNVHIGDFMEDLTDAPVSVENDANVAALAEAKLLKKEYEKVLYITISTGIGTGIITNGIIDPEFADSEGGHMVLSHNGKPMLWEKFASGKAIEHRFSKQAREINDEATWKKITADLALGFMDLIAVLQPDIIIVGGGVGTHFKKFDDLLVAQLKKYETPLTPIPKIARAKNPEHAVIYGCYELLKAGS
jgi:glucokinase